MRLKKLNKLKTLSVILPCHNEQLVISKSHKMLEKILTSLIGNLISDYELIMVNNGSTDKTLKVMLNLQKDNKKIKIIDLRNNFDYQGSISAGLYYATKDMVITIDADLQDDPNKIKDMIKKHYDGFELVLGVRKNRAKDSVFKRMSANFFYSLSNVLGIKTIPHHGDFRLMSKGLVKDLRKYQEKNIYFRGLVLMLESKYALVHYDRKERKAGETKFKLLKLIEFAFNGITSFSITPLKLITLFGSALFIFSLLIILFVLYQKFNLGITVPGWAFTTIVITLFGGLNSIFIGIVGEYVGKVFIESKNRPVFVTRRVYKT